MLLSGGYPLVWCQNHHLHSSRLQLFFIICGLHACEFTYSLTCICTPRAILGASLQSFSDRGREVKNLSHPTHTFPAEVKQEDALPSRFNSHTVKKWSFCHLFSARLFRFLQFLLVILLFKMPPSTALMLPSVPKYKKAVLCLAKKIHGLDELHSRMRYSAVGCEFNVNESIMG